MYTRVSHPVSLFPGNSIYNSLKYDNELLILARNFDWPFIESKLSFYYNKFGAPGKPIRLMAGLNIVKYYYNLSDDETINFWCQNPYFQAFTGQILFQQDPPCDRSSMSRFRSRIGLEGFEYILHASVNLFGPKVISDLKSAIISDTTCQEKYTKYPRDMELGYDVIKQVWKFYKHFNVSCRNKHQSEVEKYMEIYRFNKSNEQWGSKDDLLQKLRNIGLMLIHEFEHKMPKNVFDSPEYINIHNIWHKALTQQRHDTQKIYSIFEPQIYCISKRKANKRFEFGTKVVYITGRDNNIIYYVHSYEHNTHDSKTVAQTLDKIYDMFGIRPEKMICDRGYRGINNYNGTVIVTPLKRISNLTPKDRKKIKLDLRRRASIEQVISHSKNDHRMHRNYLQHAIGDQINPVGAAIAHNLRRFVRKATAKTCAKPLKPTTKAMRSRTRSVPFDRPPVRDPKRPILPGLVMRK
jgi:IS5 family transposase